MSTHLSALFHLWEAESLPGSVGWRGRRGWRRNVSVRRPEAPDSNESPTEELAPNPEMLATLPGAEFTTLRFHGFS